MIKTPHQLTENTKLLHKVIIWHGGEVLILKRAENSASRPEMWDLAGGNSEWPKEGQAGAGLHKIDIAREIIEETGIGVEIDKFEIGALMFFDTFFDSKKQVFTIICGWTLKLAEDFDKKTVKISDEHTQAKWIKIDELNSYDFGGEKGQFIKDIILQSKDKNEEI